jgi:hypothetical protein
VLDGEQLKRNNGKFIFPFFFLGINCNLALLKVFAQ